MTVVPGKYCRRVLVVQGAWVDGRLALWGEGGAPLTGVVDGRLDELTVLLPTAGGRPVPSPEAAGDGPPDVDDLPPDAPVLAPWPVAAARLEPRDALAWLGDLPDPDALDDAGWVAGASVRYLAVLAGYAAGLVRRGRLLPQLVDGPAARWRPVLTGRDAAAFREFVSALPPVTRAAAADRSGGDIVRDALDGLVDAAARRAMPERLLLGHRPGPKAPLADRWAVALTADDPTLTVPPSQRGDLTVLRAELERWLRDAHEANSAFRVCFRLVEPVLVDDEWTLEFGLQSADDPGLYVPAELLWAGRRVPGFPDRPDEALLAGLGRASRLFTPLHGALREARPATTRIGTTTAYDFLRQAAPLLQAAGYGVQLPAWAGRKSIGMRLTTRAKSSSGPKGLTGGDFGLDQLVDFQVDLLVGDEKVSADDLTALARLKVPLLRVRGRWVELDDRQLKAAIRAVERHRSGELTVAEVLGEVAAGGDEDLPLVEVDADGLAGRPAVRRGRPAVGAHPDAGDVPGRVAPLPGARPVMAALPVPPRPGRRPRRRHGLGEDRADVVAAVGRTGAGRRGRTRRCWCARCRWSPTGRRRPRSSRRRCASTSTTVAAGCGRTNWPPAWRTATWS